MKETQFIQQNREKWSEFEKILTDTHRDPDKLNDLYIQITDDLSHARTFYPTRSVRAYLNGLAQSIFGNIYRQKKSALSNFKNFFTDELPQVIYESRWSFFWAVAFFILSFVIGYVSSAVDENFSRVILGDGYVNMTVENIHKGDPMAVYKSSGRFDMTFGIMLNNIRVTLMYFLLGILAGVGSVAMMMYNGIMLGAFLQFFSRYNLLKEANLTVWMHGSLEISAIVIGTAAGITMGRGLLFPGTFTRLQAFQMSARRGIKIMVGVVLMLVVAALIEGNITRHTGAGDLFRGLFIAVCFGSILFYYGWLPFYKSRKGFKKPLHEAELPPDNIYQINYQKIKSSGEVFGDAFLFFSRRLSVYLQTSAIVAVVFCFVTFLKSDAAISKTFFLQTSVFTQSNVIAQIFSNEQVRILPYLNGLLFSIIAFIVLQEILRGEKNYIKTRRENIISFIELLVIFELWSIIAVQNGGWLILAIFVLFPFFGLWAMMMFRFGFKFNFFKAIQHTRWLSSSNLSLVISSHLIMLVIGWLFFSLANSFLMNFYLWMIGWNLSYLNQSQLDSIVVIVMTFVAAFSFFLIFALFLTSVSFVFYSLLEINEANSLLNKIAQIGMSRKIRGMIRE